MQKILIGLNLICYGEIVRIYELNKIIECETIQINQQKLKEVNSQIDLFCGCIELEGFK